MSLLALALRIIVRQRAPRVGDRGMRVELRSVLELVHHVAVRGECESRVVAELARDVDHGSAFVEQQRGERVAEVVRARVFNASAVE